MLDKKLFLIEIFFQFSKIILKSNFFSVFENLTFRWRKTKILEQARINKEKGLCLKCNEASNRCQEK